MYIYIYYMYIFTIWQDPSDPECPVMKGYLNIMKTDAVAEVRRSAVKV